MIILLLEYLVVHCITFMINSEEEEEKEEEVVVVEEEEEVVEVNTILNLINETIRTTVLRMGYIGLIVTRNIYKCIPFW